MTKMAAMAIKSKSGRGAVKRLYKSRPWDYLDQFYYRVNTDRIHLNGKLTKCHCHLMGKNVKDNEVKICDSEKIWTPGTGLPPSRSNTHVYCHNVLTAWLIRAEYFDRVA